MTRNRRISGGLVVLHKGLPQRDCYDIVYRHGLDLSPDGKVLAMGAPRDVQTHPEVVKAYIGGEAEASA